MKNILLGALIVAVGVLLASILGQRMAAVPNVKPTAPARLSAFAQPGECFSMKTDDDGPIKMYVMENSDEAQESILGAELTPRVIVQGVMTYEAILRHQPVKVPCEKDTTTI